MNEDFDWGWTGTSKEDKLKEFEEKMKETGYIERIAEWYGYVVYDIHKQFPYADDRTRLIYDYCDFAYVMSDHSQGIAELPGPSKANEDNLKKSSVLRRHNRS